MNKHTFTSIIACWIDASSHWFLILAQVLDAFCSEVCSVALDYFNSLFGIVVFEGVFVFPDMNWWSWRLERYLQCLDASHIAMVILIFIITWLKCHSPELQRSICNQCLSVNSVSQKKLIGKRSGYTVTTFWRMKLLFRLMRRQSQGDLIRFDLSLTLTLFNFGSLTQAMVHCVCWTFRRPFSYCD